MNKYFEISTDYFTFKYAADERPNPDEKMYKMHTHLSCEVYYFMSGKGVFHVEGTRYPLEVGDILIMNDTESHYIELDPGVKYERCAFNFKKNFIKLIDKNGGLLEPFENRQSGEFNLYRGCNFRSGLYLQLLENMISETDDREMQITVNAYGLLNEIRGAFRETIGKESEVGEADINRIVRYIMDNLETPLSLDSICNQFYISKTQLCRSFKKSMGSSVWNYITIKRLIKAKTMIDAGGLPTKIFSECGFSDYSGFFKAYKKHFGYPPGSGEKNKV